MVRGRRITLRIEGVKIKMERKRKYFTKRRDLKGFDCINLYYDNDYLLLLN